MKINYIIACWSGMRRVNPQAYIDDRAIFLRKHLKYMRNLKHSIDQITIIISDNPDEPKSYKDFINRLPQMINNTKIEVMRRSNIGYSYGGYSDVFERYRKQFDYYLLMEDDYVFMLDNFDDIMLNDFKVDDKIGSATFWLCEDFKYRILSRTRKLNFEDRKSIADAINKYFPDTFSFPRVAVGLVKSDTLNDVWEKFGTLPYAKSNAHGACKLEGQIGLFAAMQMVGWKLVDTNINYRIAAYSPDGKILENGPIDKPLLLNPIQALL